MAYAINRSPPKAEATGSNPVGCANYIKDLVNFRIFRFVKSNHIVTTKPALQHTVGSAKAGINSPLPVGHFNGAAPVHHSVSRVPRAGIEVAGGATLLRSREDRVTDAPG